MPEYVATAPGKIILFGEHSVVYGQPAIAVPVSQVQAKVIVTSSPRGEQGSLHIKAPDINLDTAFAKMHTNHPVKVAINQVLTYQGIKRAPACTIEISSSIPVSAGLGSGAAVSTALIRAFFSFLGNTPSKAQISNLVYEVERIHHGTPSGIDNTVIAHELPVWYIRGNPIETLHVAHPFHIIIGDTGVTSSTAAVVGDVRAAWSNNPERFESLFNKIGTIVKEARKYIETGHPLALGQLMNKNHKLLQEIGVSSPELDHLVDTACNSGALGAKLSGAGIGGNMIAIVDESTINNVSKALKSSGATNIITTIIQ